MAQGLEIARDRAVTWDERLLVLPVNLLSRRGRWIAITICVLLTAGWSAVVDRNLASAWVLPDVSFYLQMAHGHYDKVPQPFSARPLAPLLARWVAAPFGWRVERGFAAIATVSLLWTSGTVFWLLSRRPVARWVMLAVAFAPFWPQLLMDAGLPDPLYSALLAGLLVALEYEWLGLAAALLLPLMLARESTSLTLVCLLAVTWRQMRWSLKALAVAGVVVGAAVVHKLSAGGLPNPEHLSGGPYLVGKVLANSVRSLGVMPWSNVYPELCGTPAWTVPLHLGPVRNVGVCSWMAAPVIMTVSALLSVFGILPWMVLFALRKRVEPGRRDLLLRFCVLYGGISFFLAPALGTWYARLFGYGWPLLLVAVPQWVPVPVLTGHGAGKTNRSFALWGSLLCVQLISSGLAFTGPALTMFWCQVAVQAVGLALVLVRLLDRQPGYLPA